MSIYVLKMIVDNKQEDVFDLLETEELDIQSAEINAALDLVDDLEADSV
ncbi:hypothetical protein [Halanaerobaculum tunisiense]